ncbi:butyrophilin-like protein 2 [Astyanax mexicanus]|uniref:butyrophilin-like protein 2 n=1 Tax=Astyanax mexicanus TaxID=7994 RepID=UPI0020CB4394|nr:butyrophilin-like protein 2 [Astyanax mexicanus]
MTGSNEPHNKPCTGCKIGPIVFACTLNPSHIFLKLFLSAESRKNAFPAPSHQSASRRSASRLRFLTVRATAGDTVILPCYLPPEISTEIREFRWFKGTDCVLQRRFSEENEGAEQIWMMLFKGELNLTLKDVKVTDSGQYRCEILAEKKEEIAVIHLHVAEFKLVSSSEDVGKPSNIQPFGHTSKKLHYPGFGDSYDVFYGDDVTLPCFLSPETSAVTMEIRWFKGADCVYLYQNGQVTEGRGYEGRVSVVTDDLQRGNVSLNLRDAQRSDSGEYRCEITDGEKKVENNGVRLRVFKLFSHPGSFKIPQTRPVNVHVGETVTLQCYLTPRTSAVTMEIRWFKGADCVYLYQNGQVTEGRGYEGRVSVITDDLQRGNVSLNLRDAQRSDSGEYRCEITRGTNKMESDGVHLRVTEFILVYRSEDVGKRDRRQSSPHVVFTFAGYDITLPCYLSPETSAVTMEIRWFKGADCVYLYQNGQVTEGRGYEGRVSVITDDLQRGNMSLNLRDAQESDDGEYRCVITDGEQKVDTELFCKILFTFHNLQIYTLSVHFTYLISVSYKSIHTP